MELTSKGISVAVKGNHFVVGWNSDGEFQTGPFRKFQVGPFNFNSTK
jgi:hypothetical protein